MKKIFSIIFVLVCFFAQAQSNGDPAGFPTINSAPYYKYNGYLQVADGKAFIFGSADTTWQPRFAGTTIYKSSDSTIYLWTGNIWQAIGSGGSGGSKTWQQTLINGSDFSQDNSSNFHGNDWLIDSAGLLQITSGSQDGLFSQLNLDISGNAWLRSLNNSNGHGTYIQTTGEDYGEIVSFTNDNTARFAASSDGIASIQASNYFELTSGGGSILDINSSGLFAFQSSTGSYQYSNLQTNANPTYVATWNSNLLGQTLLSDIISPVSSGGNVFYVEDSTNTQPVSPSDSTYWLTGGAPTGSDPTWTGNANKVLLWDGAAWSVPTQASGDYAVTLDDNITHKYNGTTWPIVSAIPWTTNGNVGGGILGSTNPQPVYIRYNNANRIIVGSSLRFPQLNGAAAGLMGLSTTGVASNVQVGSGLSLIAGTLSATGSGGTVTSVATAGLISGGTITTTGTITTSMATNKLVGRYSSGTGIMQEITISTGLSLDASGNLTATGTTPNWQQTLDVSAAVNKNNTITGAFTLALNTSRLTSSQADSLSLTATNSASITSLAGLNLWAVTLTGRAATSTITATNISTFASNTGTGDSTGWHMQLSGGRTGIYGLGLAFSAGTANRILQIDTTTKKLSWSTFDASSLTPYFTRVPTSGGTGRIYPAINVADTLQLGYSGANAGAKFYNGGTSKLDGAIGIGGANPSSTETVLINASNSTNSYNVLKYIFSSSSTGATEQTGLFSAVTATSTSASTGGKWIGVYGQAQVNQASGTPGYIVGVRGRGGLSGTGASPLYTAGLEAYVTLVSGNTSIGKSSYGLRVYGIENNSAAVDSFRWHHAIYIDSTVSTLYSVSNWGLMQIGTNATNFLAGKTLHGYTSTGDTVATMMLQMGAGRFGMAKGADVASANDLTLGNDGNLFKITGNTQINAITTTNWIAGSVIRLYFSGTPTVKNNTAGGASTAVILLSGGVDFSATANDVLTLVYDGTEWLESGRSVN